MKPMVQYRIYTEDKQPEDINRIMREYQIQGYTIFHTDGVWEDETEHSIVIEVLLDFDMPTKMRLVAEAIKAALSQQAVLVTRQKVEGVMV